MDQIDLTLRLEFSPNPTPWDDERRYQSRLGTDQRRAMNDILGRETHIIPLFRAMFDEVKDWENFFSTGWVDEFEPDYALERITGAVSSALRREYDCGFGNPDICDCCGGFASTVLNVGVRYLCTSCEQAAYMNKNFWDIAPTTEETIWVD